MSFSNYLFGALCSVVLALGCGTSNSVDNNGQPISGVDVVPNETALTTNTTKQFHATAHLADGTTKDVSKDPETVWNTSDPAVATVEKDGTVTTHKPGIVDISATYKGEKGNEHFAVAP